MSFEFDRDKDFIVIHTTTPPISYSIVMWSHYKTLYYNYVRLIKLATHINT